VEIAAPLKFLCCAREQMLREQKLREQKLRLHKSGLSRIADIHVFSREGPVWVLLSFKQ
jgi:hypothetical protein